MEAYVSTRPFLFTPTLTPTTAPAQTTSRWAVGFSSQALAAAPTSITSKLVVMAAVLANMMLAEQYLSWLMAMARSTALAGKLRPLTVKCM